MGCGMNSIVGNVISVKCSVFSSMGGMLCRFILMMIKLMFYISIMVRVSSRFLGDMMIGRFGWLFVWLYDVF